MSVEASVKYSAGALSALQTASGRETNSTEADPQFTVLEYPYALSGGSPASGMGVSDF